METLRTGSRLRIGGFTLVPVERVRIESIHGGAGYWISALKEVHAVVVSDANGARAFAMDFSEIALDALIEEVPGLAAVLSAL